MRKKLMMIGLAVAIATMMRCLLTQDLNTAALAFVVVIVMLFLSPKTPNNPWEGDEDGK